MKRRLSYILGLVASEMAVLVSGPTDAQTVAGGPYYATPSWDQTLPASTRFIVLSNFGNNAVLDRETGLVWERAPRGPFLGSPTLPPDSGTFDWDFARSECAERAVGGRRGWRLPSFQELASLVDPSVPPPGPTLPPGGPFLNVQSGSYWTATVAADLPTNSAAWAVQFDFGVSRQVGKDGHLFVWCVRGGGPLDRY